ncbi:DUF58 domain-containing protein [Sessilibacter corallicola]|uniref:DUF58 domain-containing protein n=1 Tax=Sessilibacter corallicola TaxID=2904075 RepID=A0ABQ0AF04_9GAMM
MRPTKQFVIVLIAWCLIGFVQGAARVLGLATEIFSLVWAVCGITLFFWAAFDYFTIGKIKDLIIERSIPTSLALGAPVKATMTITNTLSRGIRLLVSEPPNPKLTFSGLPVKLILEPQQAVDIDYSLTAINRGEATLKGAVARIQSKYRLWDFTFSHPKTSKVKIYPNFAPIAHLSKLGIEQQIRQLGVHLSQKRGDGMEFKQLREFTVGDSLRQIDWKTTSRYQKPISREYQDEQNQEVYFLLDCGRRLRHKDDELSHFDHALNAILLTAYIAIRQGDACGFSSYSGEEKWLNPVKGPSGINVLLNTLYDLESTKENTDFLKLAEKFVKRNSRRSLIIIVSNVREEDYEDLIQATKVLSKNHIVLVASLKEHSLVKQLDHDINTVDDALSYSETHRYLQNRKTLATKLRSSGVHIIDTLPNQLHVQLVTEYFRLKRSHLL